MSVTKLKTVGSWWAAFWQGSAAEIRTNVRGRVITGMLTGDDAAPDALTVAQDPHEPQTR
jgi:predicted secreted Zn-dependent protease